jgi:hypothetical protein
MNLQQQIASKKQQHRDARARERNPRTDPRTAHEAGVSADQLDREIVELELAIAGNEKLISAIQQEINFLLASPYKSASRMIALRHLEDAQSRLIREISHAI